MAHREPTASFRFNASTSTVCVYAKNLTLHHVRTPAHIPVILGVKKNCIKRGKKQVARQGNCYGYIPTLCREIKVKREPTICN
jgi:hypothetical protein